MTARSRRGASRGVYSLTGTNSQSSGDGRPPNILHAHASVRGKGRGSLKARTDQLQHFRRRAKAAGGWGRCPRLPASARVPHQASQSSHPPRGARRAFPRPVLVPTWPACASVSAVPRRLSRVARRRPPVVRARTPSLGSPRRREGPATCRRGRGARCEVRRAQRDAEQGLVMMMPVQPSRGLSGALAQRRVEMLDINDVPRSQRSITEQRARTIRRDKGRQVRDVDDHACKRRTGQSEFEARPQPPAAAVRRHFDHCVARASCAESAQTAKQKNTVHLDSHRTASQAYTCATTAWQ